MARSAAEPRSPGSGTRPRSRGATNAGPGEPFGVDRLRAAVLAAWTDSPARYREDANAEEDLVLGGYRDRLLIELAQNASDAATRAGRPGRLAFRLADGTLVAANAGSPLDADGVSALSTLRASAKRESGSVGRFGVGFAAVLAVCEEPKVLSTGGGVQFSAERTRELVQGIPALAGELGRRGDAVPVLRLPFGCADTPTVGYDTEVRLVLRPGTEDGVRRQLAALDAGLLLALPGLAEIDVDGRMLRRLAETPQRRAEEAPAERLQFVELADGEDRSRWAVVDADGDIPAERLAGRPVEERERTRWAVRWAVPLDDGDRPVPLPRGQTVHAPTESDEPLSLGARLIATYPLAPDRRHVAPGLVTDLVTQRAAAAYVDLVGGLGGDPAVLALVPRVSLAAAALDAALSQEILDVLRSAPWLPTAAADPVAPTPGDRRPTAGTDRPPATAANGVPAARAAALDPSSDELVATLAEVVPGLLPAAWSTRSVRPVLDSLGVRRWTVADVVAELSTVDRPDSWWWQVYAALDGLGALEDADALAALPVPLADGRTAYGARGLLLAEPGLALPALTALGLRLVAEAAAHPLLERLGAHPATAVALLLDPVVQAAVDSSLDEEDPEPISTAVLALVAAAAPEPGQHPWLAELALPDADGGWSAAGELMLPGSALARVLTDGALGVVADAAVDRWGTGPLTAAGVLSHFAVLRLDTLELGAEVDLDGIEEWYDAVADRLPEAKVPPTVHEFIGVQDLELVRPEAWPEARTLLASMPAELFAPVRARIGDGPPVLVPSYPTWWLSTHPVLGGHRPDRLRRSGSVDLAGLYDEAPSDVPPFLFCPSTVDDVLSDVDSALDLLRRLADPDRTLPAGFPIDCYLRIARVLDGIDVPAPDRVRAVTGRVVATEDAVVLDAPHALPLLAQAGVAAGADGGLVADLLGLPLASELAAGRVESDPVRTLAWRDVDGADLAARRLGLAVLPGRVAVHQDLVVDGRSVPWWPADADTDQVTQSAGPAALGRALAWRHGRWSARAALTEAFAEPDRAAEFAAEDSAGPA